LNTDPLYHGEGSKIENEMKDLIKQYNESLRLAKQMKEQACGNQEITISGIISDLNYSLEWMRTGRRPGNRRGIERRAAYQRERPFDPLVMQKYFRSEEPKYEWDEEEREVESVITSYERDMIECALSELTVLEKEYYLMSRGRGIPYSDIATYYCISSSTVQTTVGRAEKKVAKHIKECLICSNG
jgi:positive control factor